jgi:hypothetical protein
MAISATMSIDARDEPSSDVLSDLGSTTCSMNWKNEEVPCLAGVRSPGIPFSDRLEERSSSEDDDAFEDREQDRGPAVAGL